MKNKKGIASILIILIIVVVFALGGGTYYFLVKKAPKPTVCTTEAKICPDGSAVGRTGSKCEFADCPNIKAGILKGKVTIGPLCPVEPCPDTVSNPYILRKIILQKQTGESFPPIILQEDGSFETEIGVGVYTLSLSDCNFLGCNYGLPKTVTIEADKTTEVEIDIDTGIR